ncbi:MAG: DUF2232 domain-containing protein [Bacteriovoracaceae bacterium]|nr:DUF2232 domain-containing protein [Bacteriovoracaceae bacterium]
MLASYAPLVIAFLLFGQTWGAILSVACLVTLGLLAPLSGGSSILLMGLVPIVVLGAGVAYFIRKGISPQRIVVCSILIFIGLIVLFGSATMMSEGLTFFELSDQMMDSIIANLKLENVPEAKSFKVALTEGRSFGVKVKYLLPSIVCIAGAFQVWLGMFFIMLFARGWRRVVGYRYSIKAFLDFRNTEYIIVPFIILLGAYLFGHYMKIEVLSVFAINILLVMGGFFYLHGFGVYMHLLKFLKLKGIAKLALAIVGIFLLYQMLTIIGVFDLWVNFRKFLKNKIES